MQIRLVELPRPPKLPASYVHLAFYGGTSNFPLGSFYVQSAWWDLLKLEPELVIEPAEAPGTMTVETWPAAGELARKLFKEPPK